MAKRRWLRVGIAVGALLLAAAWLGRGQVARADVAPDPFQGTAGRDAGPAAITAVEMVSETVWIQLPAQSDLVFYFGQPLQTARVTADFLLHNPTTQAEVLPVGFPRFLSEHFRNGPVVVEIQNLHVYVGKSELATDYATIAGEPWQIWDMTFAPGETHVRVTYSFDVTTNPGWTIADIRYVLHTGAGWAGPIGQADLIVSFPYPAEENFIDLRSAPADHHVSGYNVSWHFENLEPTTADDLVLRVVNPWYWYDVLAARQAVSASPTAANYAALAAAYYHIVVSYNPLPGSVNDESFYNKLLAQVTEAQYRKSLELDPANDIVRRDYTNLVTTFAGTLLPGDARDYINSLPPKPTPTPQPSPTVKVKTPRPTRPAASATQSPSLTPILASLTPAHSATVPATQVAALPTAPLFTPVPIPSVDGGGNTLNTVLLVAFVALIAVGVVIALRRR